MLSSFLFSPLKIPYPLPPHLAHQPTPASWHSPLLRSLHRTKVLSSHWWLTRPSSATCTTRVTSSTMCFLWMVLYFQGSLGVLVSSYWCSSYGALDTFSSLGISLTPSLGTLCSIQWMPVNTHFCICQALVEPHSYISYIRFLSAGSCWHLPSVWWLFMGWIPKWDSLWMVIPSVSGLNFVSVTPSMDILFPLLSFWANIHLSVTEYHVCFLVTELPHSRWYPPYPSICLRISKMNCF